MNARVLPARKAGEEIGADRIREYERRKQAWLDEQMNEPICTPGAYDAAMKRIAAECGV